MTSAISRAETRRRRVRAAQRSAVHTHAWVERFPIPAQSWCRCKCWGRLLNHYAGFFESLSFKIYCASGNVHGSADHRSAGSDSGAQNKQAPMASDCRTGRGRATGPAWAMSTSVNSAKRAIMDGLKIIQVKFELRPVTVQGQILVLQLLTSMALSLFALFAFVDTIHAGPVARPRPGRQSLAMGVCFFCAPESDPSLTWWPDLGKLHRDL